MTAPDTPYLDIRDSGIIQIAKRISDLAMRFGVPASHLYELGSIETISAYDAPRPSHTDMPHPEITLDPRGMVKPL